MVKSGQNWSGIVVTRDSTGALAAPSVGPVGTLYVNGTSTLDAVTVSGSNPYKWIVTLPSLTAGDCVSMYITATIATIATAAVVAEDVSDTVRLSDGVTVASIAANAITATAINADAITAAKIADNAIAAEHIADAAIDLATFAADVKTGSALKANVETVTAGAINAAAIADDAIDAASIATGAISADAFAADAIVAATLATGVLTADAFAADAIVAATLATGAISADAIAADAITAASLADDVATEIAAGITVPSAATVADAVWNETTADHVTAGTTGKALGDAGAAGDPWTAATRTLTSSAAATVAAMSGSALVVTKSVTYGATISGLTIPATWAKILLTAKASTSLADSASQIQIQESVAGTGDGLLYIHGNTATEAGLVAGDASLTVSQAAGTIAIVIDDEATAEMVAGTYSYDVKCLLADGTSQQLSGAATFTVADAVTETV